MTHHAYRPLFSTLLAVFFMAGCSLMPESKKIDYKSTGKIPSLEVPPDLTKPTRDERYAVPDIAPRGSATYSAYAGERAKGTATAAAQDLLPAVQQMRIERSGTQRWLVVPGTPESVWSNIKDFWQEMGFIVNIETPETGVMETDWAENRAKLPNDIIRKTIGKIFEDLYSTPERDKFRTRIERSGDGGVEVYVSHRGMYEIYINEGKSQTKWQPRPADPDLEAEMLRRLMVRLGADEATAKAELAQAPKGDRARLAPDATSLVVDESFDRAWRRVGLALDRINFTVEDRDRAQGVYFVRYIDPDKDVETKENSGGFLSKLKFWDSSADKKKAAEAGDRFRVHVTTKGTVTTVQVLTREGGVDTGNSSRKILGLLHKELR